VYRVSCLFLTFLCSLCEIARISRYQLIKFFRCDLRFPELWNCDAEDYRGIIPLRLDLLLPSFTQMNLFGIIHGEISTFSKLMSPFFYGTQAPCSVQSQGLRDFYFIFFCAEWINRLILFWHGKRVFGLFCLTNWRQKSRTESHSSWLWDYHTPTIIASTFPTVLPSSPLSSSLHFAFCQAAIVSLHNSIISEMKSRKNSDHRNDTANVSARPPIALRNSWKEFCTSIEKEKERTGNLVIHLFVSVAYRLSWYRLSINASVSSFSHIDLR